MITFLPGSPSLPPAPPMVVLPPLPADSGVVPPALPPQLPATSAASPPAGVPAATPAASRGAPPSTLPTVQSARGGAVDVAAAVARQAPPPPPPLTRTHAAAAGPSLSRESSREGERRRVRAATPLPASVRLRRQVVYAAVRWLVAAGVFAGMAAYTEAQEVSMECATSRAYTLLKLWVVIVTLRIGVGGVLRLAVYRAWDTHAAPDQQPSAVVVWVRTESLLTLLSVLWTTIGFMYAYSAATLCAATPVAQFATALVVLLYSTFVLPLAVALTLRAILACGCSCGIRLVQAAVEWGVVPYQPLPAAPAQIRAIPSVKYRADMFEPDNRTCAVCLAEYTPGQVLRTLPCDRRHHFHRECIDRWLATNATCPVCRTSMLAAPPPPPPVDGDGSGGGSGGGGGGGGAAAAAPHASLPPTVAGALLDPASPAVRTAAVHPAPAQQRAATAPAAAAVTGPEATDLIVERTPTPASHVARHTTVEVPLTWLALPLDDALRLSRDTAQVPSPPAVGSRSQYRVVSERAHTSSQSPTIHPDPLATLPRSRAPSSVAARSGGGGSGSSGGFSGGGGAQSPSTRVASQRRCTTGAERTVHSSGRTRSSGRVDSGGPVRIDIADVGVEPAIITTELAPMPTVAAAAVVADEMCAVGTFGGSGGGGSATASSGGGGGGGGGGGSGGDATTVTGAALAATITSTASAALPATRSAATSYGYPASP